MEQDGNEDARDTWPADNTHLDQAKVKGCLNHGVGA